MGTIAGQEAIARYPAEAARRNPKAGMEQAAQDAGSLFAGPDRNLELDCRDLEMRWKYFFGACIVVGAALLKAGAPLIAVIAGIALAAFSNFLRHRGSSTGNGSAAAKAR